VCWRRLNRRISSLIPNGDERAYKTTPLGRIDKHERALAEYHAAMKRKYERAAEAGAFFVEPDPPEPKLP
jgi:hypothetical protein